MLTTVERFKPTPKPIKQIEEQHDSFTQDNYENQDLSFQQAYMEESSSSQLISNSDEHFNAYESTQMDSDSTIQPETTADNLKKTRLKWKIHMENIILLKTSCHPIHKTIENVKKWTKLKRGKWHLRIAQPDQQFKLGSRRKAAS